MLPSWFLGSIMENTLANMQAMSGPMKKMKLSKEGSLKSESLLLPYLPQEIINDILSFLPVKTLIKFRCVCKSWLNLVSNTNFINAHRLNLSRLNNFSHPRLILKYRRTLLTPPNCYSHYLKSKSIDSIFYPRMDDDNSAELHYLSSDLHTHISVVGSCNGLVCIAIENQEILLWNPSTRESKTLPALDEGLEECESHMFGFGYDRLSDDYKVFMTFFNNSSGQSVKGATVYSLKTNLWRGIEDLPHSISAYQVTGNFVNGVLHWFIIAKSSFSFSDIIVSFDLGKETYGEIEQPNYDDSNNPRLGLVVLEEYLSIYYNSPGICIDIWVMKEYGVRDSWIKMYIVPHTIVPKDYSHLHYVPSFILKTGEIFFKFRGGIFLYDSNHDTFENSLFRNSPDSFLDLKPTLHVESLVSPNIYNDVQIP